MTDRVSLAVVAFSALFAFAPVTVVHAEDGTETPAQPQLEQIEETSQEAVVAPSEEEAKDLSGQGFDTPSTTDSQQ